MSRVLHNPPEALGWPDDIWSPNDQVLSAVERLRHVRNGAALSVAIGLSQCRLDAPAFIRAGWLGECTLIIPTSSGTPVSRGRMRVMPVFTDAEALEAWLPDAGGHQHPSFGPPADGVDTAVGPRGLSRARQRAGAVVVMLNPAGPAGYQLDPEDDSLDLPLAPPAPLPVQQPDGQTAASAPIDQLAPMALSGPQAAARPAAALGILRPQDRHAHRTQLEGMIRLSEIHAAAGRPERAVALLAKADRVAELLGDYLRRARMMIFAAALLEALGHQPAAERLARHAVLAAALVGHGPVEMEAQRLHRRLR